jgi:hypothetical protein
MSYCGNCVAKPTSNRHLASFLPLQCVAADFQLTREGADGYLAAPVYAEVAKGAQRTWVEPESRCAEGCGGHLVGGPQWYGSIGLICFSVTAQPMLLDNLTKYRPDASFVLTIFALRQSQLACRGL